MAWKPYNPVVSPTALNLFRDCARCFYLDRRSKIARPQQRSFALQNAIDALMKKEFDEYRLRGEAHPLMRGLSGDLVPFADARLDEWRDYTKALRAPHPASGLTMYAVIDDLWLSRTDGSIHVVDYKTHGPEEPFSLTAGWGPTYAKQLDFYAQTLMNSGVLDMPISSTAYLVTEQPIRSAERFDGVLQFEAEVVAHTCDPSWIDDVLRRLAECLESDSPPAPAPDCKFCRFARQNVDA